MLMNNLDPDVAERPDDLVVYGGTGKAARDWPSFHAIVRELDELKGDETLLVQSGRPVGVFRTHEWAPRVLIANSNLVGDWATWPEFRRLEKLGLTMYGQMTAGSWIYIGTQGILQGTYETFAAVAAKRFGGDAGRHADPDRGLRRHGRRAAARGHHERRRLPDRRRGPAPGCSAGSTTATWTPSPTTWTRRSTAGRSGQGGRDADEHRRGGQRRRGLPGAAAPGRGDRHRHRPDQRPRPAELRPGRRRPRRRRRLRRGEAGGVHRPGPGVAWPRTSRRWSGSWTRGAEVFDYGNSIRGEAQLGGYDRAFAFPGFVPAYIRPLFAEGKGPFRWAALSGDPADIAATDRAVLDLFPENEPLRRLDPDGRRAGRVPGAAGPDLLARLRRAGQGRACGSTTWWRAARCPRRS